MHNHSMGLVLSDLIVYGGKKWVERQAWGGTVGLSRPRLLLSLPAGCESRQEVFHYPDFCRSGGTGGEGDILPVAMNT